MSVINVYNEEKFVLIAKYMSIIIQPCINLGCGVGGFLFNEKVKLYIKYELRLLSLIYKVAQDMILVDAL